MKIKVTIEEIVVEEFELEIPDNIEDPYTFISDEYYKSNIVLSPGECQFRQMKIHNLDNNTYTEWKAF